jgi:large subunit ribosomal protein L32
MPMPKSKLSRASRGHRRSHSALEAPVVHRCSTTGEFHEPHKAYKGSDGVWYFKGKAITVPTQNEES